ncbi:hypothetical protein EMCRGX_G017721 [Ephydatia muelleri]
MLSLDAGLRVATLLCVMQLMTTNSLDGTSQDPKISLLNDLEVLNRLYDRMMPGETDSDIFQIQCNTLRHTWHYANENGTTECMRNVACRFLPPLTNIQHEYANSCNTMIEVLCLLTDINYDIKGHPTRGKKRKSGRLLGNDNTIK